MSVADDRPFPSAWEKKRWITKTARVINGTRGVVSKSQLESLAKLKTSQIVERFMAHERFGDFLIDFNLYYLGFRPKSIRSNDYIRDDAFRFPASITAAKEVLKNGDYFRIFDFYQPLYLGALQEPDTKPGENADEVRKRHLDAVMTKLNLAVELAKDLPKNKKKFCAVLNNEPPDLVEEIIEGGIGQSTAFTITIGPWSSYFAYNFGYCFGGAKDDGILQMVTTYRDSMLTLIEQMLARDPEKMTDKSVQGIPEWKMGGFGQPNIRTNQLGAFFWRNLPNSSTNLDRKRGAYMLKHFFCDDLTPINVVIPDNHAKGKHGTDASCFACHYKLDPMAGFFRNYGILGSDYKYLDFITFDDQVTVDKDKYQAAWKAGEGRGRTWDVGYIRSTTDDSINTYAAEPEDLFEIIRNSPEAKKCIVKRAAQYTLGENQSVDAGYLEYLTEKFIEESKINSSLALKDLVYNLVISDTFLNPDPDSKSCYDFAPGQDPNGRPPCLVAYLFEKNCATCHSSSGAKGGLDLTKWIDVGGGVFSFPHLDDNKKQYSRAQTLTVIAERLTTSDEEERMPSNKYISTEDLQTLVKWVEAEKLK